MEKKKLIVWMFIVVAMLSGLVDTAGAAVSPWPMEGGNRFHTRSTRIVGPTVPVLKWSVYVSGWHPREPSIGLDGNIYVPSSGGYLTAVSPQGSVVWQRTDHPYSSPPTPAVAENGNLYTYISTPTGNIACLNSNGELLWNKISGGVESPTIAADGSVYFSSGWYTPDGNQIGPDFPLYGCATPVSEGHEPAPDIYTRHRNYSGTTLVARYLGLNDQNEPVWKTRWSGDGSPYTCSAPTIYPDGMVLAHAGSASDSVLRAYSSGGTLLWSLYLGYCGSSSMGVALGSDGVIYAPGDQKVYAINADGSTKWVSEMGAHVVARIIVDGADTVYYRTVGSLIAVASDGSTKWVLDLPGQGSPCAPPVFGNDGTLYITSIDGYLHAYDAALRLLAPNGGEDIMAGSTYTIQWDTEGEISNVLIEYSTNNGSDWSAVDPPNTGNSGLYDWLVPAVDSNQCLVRVSDASDPGVYDTSNELFTIFECQGPIVGDLNEDCYVNFRDFAIFATHWLECGNRFDPACGLE